MSVFRVDLVVEDPEPVFVWLAKHVEPDQIVRKVAYQTVKGWFIKVAFKRENDSQAFRRDWISHLNV